MLGNLGFRFDRIAGVGWNWRRGTRVLGVATREKLQSRHLDGRARLIVENAKLASCTLATTTKTETEETTTTMERTQ